MEKTIGKFFDSVGNFFTGGDQLPWCDRDILAGCEREVAEANKGNSDEFKSECMMRLSWALVHSRQPEDVQRGIAMLDASLSGITDQLKLRERLYLLAVGYYRSGDLPRVGRWWKSVWRLPLTGDRRSRFRKSLRAESPEMV